MRSCDPLIISASGDFQAIQIGNATPRLPQDVQMMDGTHASGGRVGEVDPAEARYAERLTKLKGILYGETLIQPTLLFLYSHNRWKTRSRFPFIEELLHNPT